MNLNDVKLDFSHSIQEMEVILQGLRKLPIEVALELHNKLHLGAKAMVDEHIASQINVVKADTLEVPAETTIDATAQ